MSRDTSYVELRSSRGAEPAWRDSSGFTLVEMVVTVTVVLVMVGVALLAAPGIIKSAMTSSCDAAAGSISNAINASYAANGNYSQASANGLVEDGFLVAGPQAEQFTISGVTADGVLVEFGDNCTGETAPSTWGAVAQADGAYQFGTGGGPAPGPGPAPGICESGGVCEVGDTGPGGGTVFYVDDAGFEIASTTYNYLEAAPSGWNGGGSDPSLKFGCGAVNVPATSRAGIGHGKLNTDDWLATVGGVCDGDSPLAAQAAAGYSGGGLSDWYLPAQYELTQLCRWATGQSTGPADAFSSCAGGLSPALGLTGSTDPATSYWASSQVSAFNVRTLRMGDGDPGFGRSKDLEALVRPIRAFAPTP